MTTLTLTAGLRSLSPSEIEVLRDYTSEFYLEVNTYLRNGGQGNEHLDAKVQMLIEAINKGSTYPRLTYRGKTGPKAPVGFISTSTELHVAKRFGEFITYFYGIGIPLEEITQVYGEQEILYAPCEWVEVQAGHYCQKGLEQEMLHLIESGGIETPDSYTDEVYEGALFWEDEGELTVMHDQPEEGWMRAVHLPFVYEGKCLEVFEDIEEVGYYRPQLLPWVYSEESGLEVVWTIPDSGWAQGEELPHKQTGGLWN